MDSIPQFQLIVSTAAFVETLRQRISEGKSIVVSGTKPTMDQFCFNVGRTIKWSEENSIILTEMTAKSDLVKHYESIARFQHLFGTIIPGLNETQRLKREISKTVQFLRSLVFQYESTEETQEAQGIPIPASASSTNGTTSNKVFIVHGHDEAPKEAIARFVTKLDLQPVILHEQTNQGRTIIEKFEHHSDVAFAIVILSPDDIGYERGKEKEASPRARQNVIFELGFLIARIGRERVCSLCSPGVETPSDYDGVVYVPLDKGGVWKTAVAREMGQRVWMLISTRPCCSLVICPTKR